MDDKIMTTLAGMDTGAMNGIDWAVDMGAEKMRAWKRGGGLVLDIPAVVAFDKAGEPQAIGSEALRLEARSARDSLVVKTAVRNGVFQNREAFMALLGHVIRDAAPLSPSDSGKRPSMLLAVSRQDLSPVEIETLHSISESAGYGEVILITQGLAAAVALGAPATGAACGIIMNIGRNFTVADVIDWDAVNGAPAVPASFSSRVGGGEFDVAISRHIKQTRQLDIGEKTANEIKMKFADANPAGPTGSAAGVEFKGRHLVSGLPGSFSLGSDEVSAAIREPAGRIVDVCRGALAACPQKLLGDLRRNGVTLIGGGAKMPGLDQAVAVGTGLPVKTADTPELVVVRGLGMIIEGSPTA